MTADQAFKKMMMNTKADNLDLMYNWIRQGELRNKDFKEIIRRLFQKNIENYTREI